ncbi:MAG: cryptochrome/photolyase family protein [Candidatus Nanohaloarchaea archaeon]|nr:cryptochrome/photolyase family protein [Candidatus Nanohaloarchaea archaeon]
MQEPVIVFPHQLFGDHPQIQEDDTVVLVEAPRFFTAFDYHVKKLVLHRASMQAYRDRVEDEGMDVRYLRYDEDPVETVFDQAETVRHVDTVDHRLRERLEHLADDHGVERSVADTPMFMTGLDRFRSFFEDRDYQMTPFYIEQRKALDILVEDGSPVGGQWSFDPENRDRLPEDTEPPELPDVESERVAAATEYVREEFPDAPGIPDEFIYPVTHGAAEQWLDDFLEHRLDRFGPYQDALERDETFLFHSVLTPMLNIGLLTPEQVVAETLDRYEDRDYPLQSVEGFVRQIIGWREFMRGIYEMEGERERESNHFGNDRELPGAMYTGDTGIPPVDAAINRVLQHGYTHHIERLMVLGNFMLLLEIDPDEVYRWFMELFADAYDWVMVPNVYGMAEYADGGLFASKPYIASSNYIGKMSHYDGGEWEDILDGLYWRFIDEHRERIEENPRLAVMTSHLDRMDGDTLERHRDNAETFIDDLYAS